MKMRGHKLNTGTHDQLRRSKPLKFDSSDARNCLTLAFVALYRIEKQWLKLQNFSIRRPLLLPMHSEHHRDVWSRFLHSILFGPAAEHLQSNYDDQRGVGLFLLCHILEDVSRRAGRRSAVPRASTRNVLHICIHQIALRPTRCRRSTRTCLVRSSRHCSSSNGWCPHVNWLFIIFLPINVNIQFNVMRMKAKVGQSKLYLEKKTKCNYYNMLIFCLLVLALSLWTKHFPFIFNAI